MNETKIITIMINMAHRQMKLSSESSQTVILCISAQGNIARQGEREEYTRQWRIIPLTVKREDCSLYRYRSSLGKTGPTSETFFS